MDNINDNVLDVIELCKNYGDKKILKNITFSVRRGEIVGFLGPNGAGKSTIMNIITGYLSMTTGSIKVCGFDILENPIKVKEKIGYLPEIPPLYYDMKVYEYLSFVYELKKCKLDKKKHIFDCMELVKINDVSNRMIKTLSKGYKQRIGLAQSLIGDPELLILDEPTVGLDPAQIIEFRKLISDVGKTRTVILSTHILQEITSVCNKIIIINNGKIITCDTLENLENDNRYKITAVCSAEKGKEIFENNGFTYVLCSEKKGETAFYVTASKDKDVRIDIFNAFADSNIPIIELTSASKTIEDIYTKSIRDSVEDNMNLE